MIGTPSVPWLTRRAYKREYSAERETPCISSSQCAIPVTAPPLLTSPPFLQSFPLHPSQSFESSHFRSLLRSHFLPLLPPPILSTPVSLTIFFSPTFDSSPIKRGRGSKALGGPETTRQRRGCLWGARSFQTEACWCTHSQVKTLRNAVSSTDLVRG